MEEKESRAGSAGVWRRAFSGPVRLLSRIKKWWLYQRVQQQIFFSLLLVSLFGIGLLGSVSYRISSKAVEKNYQLSHESSLKNSSKVLDTQLSPIIEMIRSFLNDADLQRILENQTADGRRAFTGEEQRVLKSVGERLTKQENSVNYVAFMDL